MEGVEEVFNEISFFQDGDGDRYYQITPQAIRQAILNREENED